MQNQFCVQGGKGEAMKEWGRKEWKKKTEAVVRQASEWAVT